MNIDYTPDKSDIRPGHATSVAETGLNYNNLIKLILKSMYVVGLDTPKAISNYTKLHIGIVKELLTGAKDMALVEILEEIDEGGYSSFRYRLSGQGRDWATDALAQCSYLGPAPVTLDDYKQQTLRQSVKNEHIRRETLINRFEHLVVPESLERNLGPAVNSGRSILLYGAPGNGKTSIAEAISTAFDGCIFIPYCIEIDGEIIKIYDPVIHHEFADKGGETETVGESAPDRPEFTDRRWLRIDRPVVLVGGELTLDMLDLYYSADGKFYEAPLQMKANGGTFIVDDLGRQLVNPKDMLNRWIVPMDKRIDYMVLQSGGSFSVPFDNLLIFSTNLEPSDLMDPAFLRRIPYKIEVDYPNEKQFRAVFEGVCEKAKLPFLPDALEFVIHEIKSTYEKPLSFYQPKFIADQVIASSKYQGVAPEMKQVVLKAAISNIWAQTSETNATAFATSSTV